MILLVGVVTLPLGLFYTYCLYRSVLLGWICLLALQLYIYAFGISLDQFNLGPIHLDVFDVLELCLLVAGIMRTIRRLRERNTARIFVAAYLVFFAFSFLRGSLAHGLPAAGNESRAYAAFLIACLYFLTAPVDSESVRNYVRVLLYFGLGLALVAILAWAGLDIGGVAYAHHDPFALAELAGRVLPADPVLLIAFCFFLSLGLSYHRKHVILSKWLPAVFLGLAVLLRHRTVWAVLVAGLVLFFTKDRALFRHLIPAGAFAFCLIAGYAILAGNAAQSVEAQLYDSATNDDTWVWRVEGWQQLILGEQQSFISVLFGRGVGGGYGRFDPTKGLYNDAPPHSEYVTQFFNLGTTGLLLVLCLMIRPLRRFWKLSSTDMLAVEPSAAAWTAVLIGIMVYSIAYDPPVEAYALLGIANAMVVRRDKETGPISKASRGRRLSRVYSRTLAESE